MLDLSGCRLCNKRLELEQSRQQRRLGGYIRNDRACHQVSFPRQNQSVKLKVFGEEDKESAPEGYYGVRQSVLSVSTNAPSTGCELRSNPPTRLSIVPYHGEEPHARNGAV